MRQAWESDEAIEEDMPESPGSEKQDKEKDHRDSKKNRGETPTLETPTPENPRVLEPRDQLSTTKKDAKPPCDTVCVCVCPPAMKTSVSMDVSDQKKTRVKLKKFLTRRPTYQAVRDKGYIKGSPLDVARVH